MADSLDKQVKDLRARVDELEKRFNQSDFLKDDFSKIQIFNREVKFNKKVYNASGGVEINP